MGMLFSFLLVTLAGLFAIPVIVFCIETLAAMILPQQEFLLVKRQRIAVLVPAHNESEGMLDTLDDIKAQLHSGDRLLVVADNCTDDTAAVATKAGAEVTERQDLARIGKGYAMDWGLQHLSVDPPEIVIVIDADCRLATHTLDQLATVCAATRRPVQSLYLMTAPDESPINSRVAMFAFRVKNWVRPLGLRALHLPCQLMGTGMDFPWKIISSADVATGAAVEDLKLGLEMASVGHPPLFCPTAEVHSQFPSSVKGTKSQRKRWERGHLAMIATTFPRLVYKSLTEGNFRLLALTLDMAVPPLTLLGALLSLMLLISGFGVLLGLPSTALIISAADLSAYALMIVLCWLNFGRDILPLNSILSVASYVVGKLSLYRQIASREDKSQWIRTDREKIEKDSD
jgi:cellulose synthase/poly-beta-1,6-N-acetylglucosamine synthase-like glycosyltransferase